jgi:phosphopantetheinyl transferase
VSELFPSSSGSRSSAPGSAALPPPGERLDCTILRVQLCGVELVLGIGAAWRSGAAHAPPGPPPRWLSPPERREWACFATRKRADEFRSGRTLLRQVLAAAGYPAAGLVVRRTAYREPRLAGLADPPPFSICHCGGGAGGEGRCLVVTGPPGTRVGIDAEPLASPPAASALAVMAAGAERDELAAAPPRARLRAWVVKECVQKALGLGMALDPRAIDTRRQPVVAAGCAVAVELLELDGLLVAVGCYTSFSSISKPWSTARSPIWRTRAAVSLP